MAMRVLLIPMLLTPKMITLLAKDGQSAYADDDGV